MTATSLTGPLFITGQTTSPISGNPPSDYNPDIGPSGFAVGTMLLDPRAQLGTAIVGFYQGNETLVINQAPATLGTAKLAALANVVAATPMTLAVASTGITVLAAALTLPNGKIIPSGCLVIDGNPTSVAFGTSGVSSCWDVRKMSARTIAVTGVVNGAGLVFTIRGYDVYGYAMSEAITCGAGVNTVAGIKGFKFIASITPATTDAHNYSVGTLDVFEFPLAVYDWGEVTVTWDAAQITASTGFLAAVTTTATTTTGSVRGTYAVQSAADGTKKLIVSVGLTPWNAVNANGTASLFGVTQA